MSKRSPYWHVFAVQTPLGYPIAGHFNTEPGAPYGTIRFTHVDGPLPRPYSIPGLPATGRPALTARGLELPRREGLLDLRAVERLDGTQIGFYPLFDQSGALVEVVPRTQDTVVAPETPWRSLAGLVGRVRHAGIEEAVRRQRAVFVFTLVGSENARPVAYPFELRLILHSVLRNNGRMPASFAQMRAWSNQYGLDLPATRAELDAQAPSEAIWAQAAELVHAVEHENSGLAVGRLVNGGLSFWLSGRGGVELWEWPARISPETEQAIDPAEVWQAMGRLADQGITPTSDATAALLAAGRSEVEAAVVVQTIAPAWDQWARVYPDAFPARDQARIAV